MYFPIDFLRSPKGGSSSSPVVGFLLPHCRRGVEEALARKQQMTSHHAEV